jgi:hypothetical protein
MNLYAYSNSLINRLFKVIDLTHNATNESELQNVERFVGGLIVEIEGCLRYYENIKFGEQMTNVLMKMNGIKSVSDYSVRRKAVLDSIEIINRIKNSIPNEES